jgi:hypothetical protein
MKFVPRIGRRLGGSNKPQNIRTKRIKVLWEVEEQKPPSVSDFQTGEFTGFSDRQ